jgi:folate-binding protein YgfZ
MTLLADRALIRLSGEDVRGFLQGLVTNDLSGDLPVWAGLLTPQGKALFDFFGWADGDDVLVDCEGGQAAALAKRLTLYCLRRPITIAVDGARGVHWSADGQGDPRLSGLGRRWLAEPEGDDVASTYRAHRLRHGAPEGVAELGQDATLWLECNARELHGVSFTKGCYVGQENTARMHHRDKVRRRVLVLPAGTAPAERVRVSYDDLGLEVAHVRIEDVAPDLLPEWLTDAN